MARKSKPDILEWTVTDAPDSSETEPLPPSVWEPTPAPPEPEAPTSEAQAQAHHFQISRRIWLILGTAIVGLLLGAGLYTLWNQYRIRGQVERFVAGEEQAALAGDAQQIRQLTDNGDPGWLSEHAAQAEMYQAAPAPMPILWGLPEAGIAQSIRSIASDTVQVDVARKFATPDGDVVTFALPQFYRYARGQWKRIAPPKTVWGEETTRPGLRVNVTYYPVDQEFAVELSDYLEGMLAQACAAWICPDDLKLDVKLATTRAATNPIYYSPFSQGSLLISLMDGESFNVIYGGPRLTLASPHAVGYPADAASADLLKRVIAVEALANAAHQIAPDSASNEFLYALVERMAVRLKLEPSKVTEMHFVNPGLAVEDLWGNSGAETPYLGGERLRGALAILNRLLQDQPADTEVRLFNLLPANEGAALQVGDQPAETKLRLFRSLSYSASDPAAWLSAGMGISLGEARDRLRAVTEDPYPIKVLTADPHDFTLMCPDGLAVLSRGDAQPTRLLSEYLFETYPAGWSPDGERLAIYLSGQWAVVDFESGTVLWPPRSSTSYNILGWAADTVIAYQTWPQSTNSSASNPMLAFYDFADPERGFPELPGIQQYIQQYVLSPDKSLAAAILPHKNQSGRGQLALMPALGSSLTLLDDDASSPTWSPSGDALAYVRVAAGAVSLNLANPTTVMTREVWSSQESGLRSQSGDFQIVWSPTGKLIALTSNIYSSNSDSWIILTRPDGSGVRVLSQREENAASYPSGFSADGKYFAVTRLHPRSWILSTTLIYDTATGDIIRTLSNMLGWTPWSSAWSPTGREMVLNAYDGVYLLADPGDPNSQPDQLTGARCFGLMWNPGP
jgi:hypothetical protein